MRAHMIIILSLLLSSACFGPVEPSHPLDPDTPLSSQAKGSLHLTLVTPMLPNIEGYISLSGSRSIDTPSRLYLEDFTFEGVITQQNGGAQRLYSIRINELSPDVYAMYSFIPRLRFAETPLFQLDPNSDLYLEHHLEEM